ncbi:hypothetical protein [Enterocloster citroniae]
MIMFMCLCAPLFTQYSSTKVDLRNILSPPTASHIMGTDKIGRDIWARVLYGGAHIHRRGPWKRADRNGFRRIPGNHCRLQGQLV